MTHFLVFLDGCYAFAWLRIDASGVVARGTDLAAVRADAVETPEIIAVVSGTSVVIHWVELPPLAPAQAAAAAQLLGADVCGGTLDATHVALGATGIDGTRPLALVEKTVMTGWLATLASHGLVAQRIVPLPLLLPPPPLAPPLAPAPPPPQDSDPERATVAQMTIGEIGHVRGPGLAMSGELPLIEVILAGRVVTTIDPARFEAALAPASGTDPINLRQGEFACAVPSRLDKRRLRRIAATALAAAALWLGTEVAALLRDNFAADRVEQNVADAARLVLPRGTAIDAPRAQVAALADQLGAGGHSFSALAAPFLAALQDRPAIMLKSARYALGQGLAVVAEAPAPADRQALGERPAPAGQSVTIGPVRDDGGVAVVDIMIRPE